MTPSKSKKPLPSSTSIAFPLQPTTFVQWKAALRRVKVLYFQGQLKQCAARSDQLLSEAKGLPHSLYTTYLHFYSALSLEGIARSTHNLSAAKIQSLQQAKASYEAAASSLPMTESDINDYRYCESEAPSEDSFSSSTLSRKTSIHSFSPPNSPSYSTTSSSSMGSHCLAENFKNIKGPSPLRIHKAVSSSHDPSSYDFNPRAPFTPPSKILPTSPLSANGSLSPLTFSTSTTTWLQCRARERFDAHLSSFADMLATHVDVINTLIRTTQEIQANRYTTRRLISYGADDEAKAEDRKARIVKLREQGWRRERFSPERYMQLCTVALEEL